MSRRVWEAVETKVEKNRMVEIKKKGNKKRRNRRKKKKIKRRKGQKERE